MLVFSTILGEAHIYTFFQGYIVVSDLGFALFTTKPTLPTKIAQLIPCWRGIVNS